MAAFAATSALAATAESGCSKALGFKSEGGVCYYDMPTTDPENPLVIPADLISFQLRFPAGVEISSSLKLHCENPLATVSVLGEPNLLGGGTLNILNMVNIAPFEDEVVAALVAAYPSYPEATIKMLLPTLVEGMQPTEPMFTCAEKNCEAFKETGLNAIKVAFKGDSKAIQLTVMQEQYNFGPMQVLHVKGIEKDGFLASAAASAGIDITGFPKDANSGLLIRGKDDDNKNVMPVLADVDVDYVYLDRKFPIKESDNVTSTIMLPFKIATDNIAGAFEIFAFSRVADNKMFIKAVYCSDDNKSSYCPKVRKEENGTLTAYNAYIARLKVGSDKLEFNGGVTLVKTPSGENPTDVLGEDGDWAFRGTLNYKKWDKKVDDELTACGGKSCVYGYAASDDKLGQFVRVGDGAYIFPFRGYLVNTNPPPPATPLAPANASYVLRPTVDIPDELEIVVDGDNGQTTSIGRFDTRTGEIHINNMKHTYDLKGRRVNGTNNARGAYYGKKVLMK
ncbi:MAG: hypothetical protein IKS96_01680 [Fibrobacter sp.]|nr:hypothetical protein [Fibrobacter sp.]